MFQYLGDEQRCLVREIENILLLSYLDNMISKWDKVVKYEEIMAEITHFDEILVSLKKYIHIQNIPDLQIQCMDCKTKITEYAKWRELSQIGMSWICIKQKKITS